jgi:hypothetical protein
LGRLVRAEIGWLGELAVDEAVVVPSGGRLIPWIPLVDAHGVDRAYTWDGIGAPWFVQVKTSGFVDDEGRHRWDLRVGSFRPSARFVVVLAIFNPGSDRIDDVFWLLDSALVHKLGRREYDSALRTEVYRLDASPTHQDRLAPYRHTREELWKKFAPPGALTAASKRSLPVLRIDQGGMYEFALYTALLRGGHKDLLLFRPEFDIKGRDLLVQLVGTSRACFLQIKGTAMRLKNDAIRFHIRRKTFVPADDFVCAFEFWDRRKASRFAECWSVPSVELARRTAHQRDANYITIDAHLDPSRDRWAEFRHPVEDQAEVLRRTLRGARSSG